MTAGSAAVPVLTASYKVTATRRGVSVRVASDIANFTVSHGPKQIPIRGSWQKRRAKVRQKRVDGKAGLEREAGRLVEETQKSGLWTTGSCIGSCSQKKRKRSREEGS